MRIIAFGHRKEVGKDTAGRLLAHMYRLSNPGSKVIKSSFAKKIYETCHQLYAWAGFKSYEYYEANPKAKNEVIIPLNNKTVRQILIEVGTPCFREIVYENTWIDYLLTNSIINKADLLIITDLRFPNEAKSVKLLGGFCIKINRSSIPITHDIADDALQEYSDWDAVINNDGTPGEFYIKIQEVCSKLLDINLNPK